MRTTQLFQTFKWGTYVKMVSSLFLLILVSGVINAASYYCDPSSGSMSNSGSSSSPWSTLQAVFDANKTFSAGDIIYLRNGDHGSPNIRGINSGYVTIKAQAGHSPYAYRVYVNSAKYWVIDGLKVSPELYGQYFTVSPKWKIFEIFNTSSYITVQNCHIFGVQNTGSSWNPNDMQTKMPVGIQTDGDHTIITNNLLEGNHLHVIVEDEGEFSEVSYNTLREFSGDAMRGLANDCKFEYNYIHTVYSIDQHHDDGFQSWTGRGTTEIPVGSQVLYRVEIRGNVIINCIDPNQPFLPKDISPEGYGMQGIGNFDGYFDSWVVENNLLVLDMTHGISFMGARNTKIVNNTVVKNPYDTKSYTPFIGMYDHKSTAYGTNYNNVINNNITPSLNLETEDGVAVHGVVSNVGNKIVSAGSYSSYFINSGAQDFRLKAGSPAIDAGTSSNAPTIDLNKYARSGNPDAGCFEYGTPVPSVGQGGGTPSETDPPSVPGNLSVTGSSINSISLSWSASTDAESGISGYNIYVNSSLSTTVSGTSATVGGLGIGTTYNLSVSAVDGVGNESAQTSTVQGTTEIGGEATVSSVSASAEDGTYVAANTIDNDLDTRWSADTDGQWLQFQLNDVYTLTSIDLSFYNGSSRIYDFDIQVSTDGSNWTNVLTGVSSSGTTDGLESFDFTNTNASYVRFVGHENSYNTWNSVNEADIYALGDGITVDATIQGEDYSAESGCGVATNQTGYTGTGFFDFGGIDTYGEWSYTSPGDGNLTLSLRYANGLAPSRPCDVTVNSSSVGSVTFATTSDWTNWVTESITIPVQAGSNTIRLTASTSDGGPNLDKLDLDGVIITQSEPDTIAPSVPTNLSSSNITTSSVDLSWTASTDNESVTGYKVYTDGTNPISVTGTSITVDNLSDGTQYSFTVSAIDAANNESAQTSAEVITTVEITGVTSDATFQSFTESTQTGSFTATFDAIPNGSAIDAITGIQNGSASAYSDMACIIRFNTSGNIDARDGGTYTATNIVSYNSGVSYAFRVEVNVASHTYDVYVTPDGGSEQTVALNFDFRTEQASVSQLTGWSIYALTGSHTVDNMSFTASAGDIIAPSVPTGLVAGTVTTTSVALSWTASTDNYGVTGYKVYTDGANPIAVAGTSTTISGLSQYTQYSFTVSAYDAASNESAQCSAIQVTTADGLAPSVPTNLASSNVTVSSVDLSWTASTDNVGVTGYKVYTGGANPISVAGTSTTISGLLEDTQYSFTVSAVDAVGNESSQTSAEVVTTASSGGGSTTVDETIQAEDYSNVNDGLVKTLNAGYTGTGYLDYGANGAWGEWTTTMAGAGTVTLAVTYSNGGTAARQCAVIVNGSTVGNLALNVTTDWTTWVTETIDIDVVEGSNTIRIMANTSQGGPNVDKLDLDGTVGGSGGGSTDMSSVTVTASAYEMSTPPNLPENSVDGDLNTRWAASGDGQWIQYELSEVRTVTSIEIAFYQGDVRYSIFDVQLSTDGSNWTTVLTNQQSSGSSTSLESFDFTDGSAKYVKIVGHGNSVNTWNSYFEVVIHTQSGYLSGEVELAENNEVKMYPNPLSNEQLTINLNEGSMVTVYNITGKRVYASYAERNELYINREIFAEAGLYIVTIMDANGVKKTEKLIVK